MTANEANSIQRAQASTTVAASIDRCYDVVLDLEHYPDWVQGIAAVDVQSTDEHGRPSVVGFEAEGLGRRTTYSLRYDLSGAPQVVAWSLVSGDVTRAIEGRYVFSESGSQPPEGTPLTDVTYELAIDLKVPLPGFVKRRAEDKIVDAALRRFKQRVESVTG